MNAFLARLQRGYVRIWAWVSAKTFGVRPYRFEGEQQNHAEQAAQTEVSLGLMAAAATRTDDDSLRQALQTEHTMRARLAVLDANRAERGLTPEESWERASIVKGLAELAPEPVTLETHGGQRLATFAGVGQRRNFLPALSGFAAGWQMWLIAGAVTLSGWGFGAVQMALKERVENQRDEARVTSRHNAAAAERWRERSEFYREGMIDAANTAQEAARGLQAERAANDRRAAQERRRQRAIQDVLTNSPEPPDWRLRDDEPAAGGEQSAP